MASGTIEKPRSAARQESPERFIDRQLRRTKLQVRLVDIVASLAIWLVAMLASFLVLALCDHWLVSIGTFGRWIALVGLAGFSGYYFAMQFGPLVWRRINSAYAAKVIEDAEPSLKNSLLNFLLLRGNPAGVPEVVVDALRDRAAADLTHTPVDHAVDRTPLIRLGYVLCGVMIAFVGYKILSPKDPFRTVARVLAPWVDIARPSRVQILKVEPGDADVYQGQTVAINAQIEGARERDVVELIYTTADGQTVDAVVPMASTAGVLFASQLPPGPSDAGGLQQDITYRVKAGDSESPQYRLHVLPSPRIDVERVELHFPGYTKKPQQILEKQGDIRAVEGTRVVVHAKANQEISSAYIEFDPTADSSARRTATTAMKAEGTTATGEFRLERLRDGAARHTSYRVRFVSPAGMKDEGPTLHRIEAIADLAPEIEVLAPMERRLELPVDRTLKVELRGRDPDFGLCRITLELRNGEEELEPVTPLDASEGQLGPANVSYVVVPKKLGLQPGDDLTLVGVAEDNRHDAEGNLKPNVSRTDRYVIHITPPENRESKTAEKPMNADGNDSDTRPPMPSKNDPDNKQPNPPKESEKPENKGNNRDESADMGDTGENETGAGDKKNDSASSNEKKEPGSKSANEKKQQQTGGSGGQSDEDQEEGSSTENSSESSGGTGKPSSKKDQGTDSGESSGNDSSSENSSGNSKAGSQKKPGSKASDGSRSNDGSEGGDETGDPSGSSNQGSQNADDKSARNAGEPAEGETDGQQPKHDGVVFEKVNERMREQQEGKPGEGSSPMTKGSEKTGANGKPTKQQPGDSPENSSNAESGDQGEKGTEGATGQKSATPNERNQQTSDSATGGEKPREQEGGMGEKPAGNEKKREGPQEGSAGQRSEDQGDAAAGEKPGNPMNPGGKEPEENESSKVGGQGKQGDPGSGRTPNESNPTGEPQKPSRDTPKTPKPENGRPETDEPSASPSSKKQSDSQGDTSGDEAGGGGQGAGQSAKQKGTDAPGSSQSADDGSGVSQEEGAGETGSKAGGNQKADRSTDKSGNEQGPGSKSKPGEQGSKQSPNEGGNEEEGAGQQAERAADSDRKDPSKTGVTDGQVTGGGIPSEGEPQTGVSKKVDVADTEAENLEYAKRATDLALKYLKDQKDNPDPELLKRLGWTKDDLDAFVQRWESLKKTAKEDTETRQELDDAYRSLGLRPAADKRRSAGAGDDAARSLRDAGARSEPPAGYAEQFKAFRKGVGRSNK